LISVSVFGQIVFIAIMTYLGN